MVEDAMGEVGKEELDARMRELSSTVDVVRAERDEYRQVIRALLRSAAPHPVEHPTMWKAWRLAEDVLARPLRDGVTSESHAEVDATDEAFSEERIGELCAMLDNCVSWVRMVPFVRSLAEDVRSVRANVTSLVSRIAEFETSKAKIVMAANDALNAFGDEYETRLAPLRVAIAADGPHDAWGRPTPAHMRRPAKLDADHSEGELPR